MSFIRDNVVEIITEDGHGDSIPEYSARDFEYWIDDDVIYELNVGIISNYKDYIHSALELSGFNDMASKEDVLFVKNNERKEAYEIKKMSWKIRR